MINNIFATLNDNQKQTLQYANEHGIPKHIEYSPGKFIGVYTGHITYLTSTEVSGNWSIGEINGKKKENDHPVDK